MTVGLQVINEDGVYQISEGYYNLLAKQKIVVSVAPNESRRDLVVPHSGSPESIVAIHSEVVFVAMHPNQDALVAQHDKATIALFNPTNQTQTFTLIIFDVPWEIPDGGFGLQVFDAAGRRIYTTSAPAKLTLFDLPQGLIGFYPYYYAWSIKTSSRAYMKIEAIRVTAARQVQYRMIDSSWEFVAGLGPLDASGGPSYTQYVDITDIL